jgi:hypothetical protein
MRKGENGSLFALKSARIKEMEDGYDETGKGYCRP